MIFSFNFSNHNLAVGYLEQLNEQKELIHRLEEKNSIQFTENKDLDTLNMQLREDLKQLSYDLDRQTRTLYDEKIRSLQNERDKFKNNLETTEQLLKTSNSKIITAEQEKEKVYNILPHLKLK